MISCFRSFAGGSSQRTSKLKSGWTFDSGSGRLIVRFTRHPQAGCFLLLVDEEIREGMSPLEDHLSPREQQVVEWLGQGKSNEEIAIILGISAHTVKNHLDKIFRKLGVENRCAAAVAIQRQHKKIGRPSYCAKYVVPSEFCTHGGHANSPAGNPSGRSSRGAVFGTQISDPLRGDLPPGDEFASKRVWPAVRQHRMRNKRVLFIQHSDVDRPGLLGETLDGIGLAPGCDPARFGSGGASFTGRIRRIGAWWRSAGSIRAGKIPLPLERMRPRAPCRIRGKTRSRIVPWCANHGVGSWSSRPARRA